MIFKQVLVDQILAGNKTMTRRPVKPRSQSFGGVTVRARTCAYQVGKTYAVQPGRGKKQVARIRVLAVRRERWIDISVGDARAEGFPLPDSGAKPDAARVEFYSYVQGLYPDLDLTTECWVIEFELVEVLG